MNILCIDPGPEQSGFVVLEGGRVAHSDTAPNDSVLEEVVADVGCHPCDVLVIEMVASYGMAVGKTVFDTCVWIGRFIEAWDGPYELVYRKDVKMALCGNMRAKDANIRQALIDRFGPGKDKAIGKKKTPGPLYGIKGHQWSALAVGVTYLELHKAREKAA